MIMIFHVSISLLTNFNLVKLFYFFEKKNYIN